MTVTLNHQSTIDNRPRADLERLAQYIIRNSFAVEKMQVTEANRANPNGSIIYRSGMNPKIQRNFEVFTPCEFIAAITQHIPDKSFQLVRYYGWYSNKMRGQRGKKAVAAAQAAGNAAAIIDVSEHKPRRIPSPKWRELINSSGSRFETADCRETIVRIHLGGRITSSLQPTASSLLPGPDPPADWVIEPCLEDATTDYDTDLDLACANG